VDLELGELYSIRYSVFNIRFCLILVFFAFTAVGASGGRCGHATVAECLHAFPPGRRSARLAECRICLFQERTDRFEQMIQSNHDIGRLKQIRLIFARRITGTTPGSFAHR
jgi:hypothetical protein